MVSRKSSIPSIILFLISILIMTNVHVNYSHYLWREATAHTLHGGSFRSNHHKIKSRIVFIMMSICFTMCSMRSSTVQQIVQKIVFKSNWSSNYEHIFAEYKYPMIHPKSQNKTKQTYRYHKEPHKKMFPLDFLRASLQFSVRVQSHIISFSWTHTLFNITWQIHTLAKPLTKKKVQSSCTTSNSLWKESPFHVRIAKSITTNKEPEP